MARNPANRVRTFQGTIHYAAENGRPACGGAKREHFSWMTQTTETVTCKNCLKQFGEDYE